MKTSAKTLRQVSRLLLVGGVVTLLSLLFPREGRFRYDYAEGQKWNYPDLTAPFDFPVQRNEFEYKKEVEELQSSFSPYYRFDPTIEQWASGKFDTLFNLELISARKSGLYPAFAQKPEPYRTYGKKLLKQVFNAGILRLASDHPSNQPGLVLQVVRGNVTERIPVGQLRDSVAAQAWLTDSLPFSGLADADVLLFVMEDLIRPNLHFDRELTERLQDELLAAIPQNSGMVRQGEKLVRRDEIISPHTFQVLDSFERASMQDAGSWKKQLVVFFGYWALLLLIISAFVFYLRVHIPEMLNDLPKLSFILLWFLVFGFLTVLIKDTPNLSVYLLPFSIVPIVIKNFFSDRLAFFTHIVNVLLVASLTGLGFEFTFLQILAGLIAVLTVADTQNWSRFFSSIGFIFLAYVTAFLAFKVISGDLAGFNFRSLGWFVINLVLTMLAFPLIPLLAKIFNFNTSITLLELADMNRPLLRELALKAPGTFQHSIQVSNLSDSAAREIGADHVLVKVAALYHDIGKTIHPEYFIENQTTTNPHIEVSRLESAKIIIDHVHHGAAFARRARLPQAVINFIWTHHGTTRVEYFFRHFRKENPDLVLHESEFRYPGPKPQTREQTILMLADSLEAASRSLKNPSGKDIDDLIESVVNHKVQDGQLNQSRLTFEELIKIKAVFSKMLRSIHHIRIEYPEESATILAAPNHQTSDLDESL
jgi:hypothetical protein